MQNCEKTKMILIWFLHLNKMTDALSLREKKEARFMFFGEKTIYGFALKTPSLDYGYPINREI